MTSRFATNFCKMWRNANLSLTVAFVRNDPHATKSTAGCRLIISPCGMPACVTLRGTSHSPKGSLQICVFTFALRATAVLSPQIPPFRKSDPASHSRRSSPPHYGTCIRLYRGKSSGFVLSFPVPTALPACLRFYREKS